MIAIQGKNYSIGKTTVTQGQWKQIMGTEPWKGQLHVMEGDDYPAVYVSWDDATAFCKKLSDREDRTYRLPTEAEWEYACRAGSTTNYYFGDDATKLGDYAWFDENTWNLGEKYAHRVAQKQPNKFGIYDMHGNVWEWCSDFYDVELLTRIMRGGSWIDYSNSCYACSRDYFTPDMRDYGIGFRLAMTV